MTTSRSQFLTRMVAYGILRAKIPDLDTQDTKLFPFITQFLIHESGTSTAETPRQRIVQPEPIFTITTTHTQEALLT